METKNFKKFFFKKFFLIAAIILVGFLIFSQTTLGRQIDLPAWIVKAFQNLFSQAPLGSGIVKDYSPDEYWVYIQPKDDITTPDMISGRTQKGDIVDIISLSRGNGAYAQSKEFLIVRVKGLTPELISRLMERYTEGEEQKAERKYRLDLDNFKSKNDISIDFGTAIFTINASDVTPIEKTKDEIISYQKRAQRYAKTEWLRKLARKIIPFVYAHPSNIRYVDPDAAAGGDGTTNALSGANCAYQSLNLWEAARNAVLSDVEECICESNGAAHTADTTAVSILGWTTTADYYIYIHTSAAARHSGKYDTNKYRLEITNAVALSIVEEYTRVDGIQISTLAPTAIGKATLNLSFTTATGGDIRISNSIFKGHNDATYWQPGIWFSNLTANQTVKIWNNLFYNFNTILSGNNVIYFNVANVTSYWYNNTVINGYISYRAGAGTIIAKNNISQGSGGDGFTGTFAVGSDYNLSNRTSDTTGGDNDKAGVTVVFVNSSNYDFHLSSADDSAKDSGVDLSSDGNLSFATDIDGNPRPQGAAWDIGADEYGHKTIINSPRNYYTSGLVGYWTFDGPATNWTSATEGTTNDLSGQGNTGTMTNMSRASSPAEGINGQALSFDGVNDYVNAGTAVSLDDIQLQGGGGMTVSFWIKPSSNTSKKIIAKGAGGAGNGFWAIYKQSNSNPARLTFQKEGTTDMVVDYNYVMTTGVWQHIVVTWDGSMLASGVVSYKNGALITQALHTDGATANSDASLNFMIGGTTDSYGDEVLDEVRVYNRVLGADEIADLYRLGAARMKVNSPPSAPFGNSGLVGYWSFNGQDTNWTSATAGTTNDLSGNSNTGTMTNMSRSTSPVPGISGQALSFDGVNDYVQTAHFDIGTAVTFSAWVKPSVLKNADIIREVGGGEDKEFMWTSTGKFLFYLHNCFDGSGLSTNTTYSVGNWYHVVGVYDGNNKMVYMYVNGIQDGSKSISAVCDVTDYYAALLLIGNNAYGGTEFNGLIDEVRIYNRVLSASEIQDLYRVGTRKFQPTQ